MGATIDSNDYIIGREENTFLRTAVQEFVLIQLLRAHIIAIPDEVGRKALIEQMRREARQFNDGVNKDGDPQSRAWKAKMAKQFDGIYDAASALIVDMEATSE